MALTMEEKSFLKRHLRDWKQAATPLVEKLVRLSGSNSLKKKIEDAVYNTAFAIHCRAQDGFEMLEALLDEDRLPEMPSDGLRVEMSTLDLFAKGHPLSHNKTFREFQNTMFEISNKGKGKGELLLAMIIRNVVPSVDDEDVSIESLGAHRHIEVKAGNATLKGTADASFRAVDASLDELFPGERKKRGTSPQFETDNIFLAERILTSVYGFGDDARSGILEGYKSTVDLPVKEKVRLRKQDVGFETMRKYQDIDGFDTLVFLKPHKSGIAFCAINDFSVDNKKEVCDNINFKPQSKRGGGTQAVGDGYTDAELLLR